MASVVINIRQHGEQSRNRFQSRLAAADQLYMVISIFAPDFFHASGNDELGFIYQCDVVTKFLDRFHIMGRKDNRGPLVFQFQDFLPDQFGIDRIKT